jgi:hypothetical protein
VVGETKTEFNILTNDNLVSDNTFYKLEKKHKSQEKLDRKIMDKQFDNFNNIKQTLGCKNKVQMRSLNNIHTRNSITNPDLNKLFPTEPNFKRDSTNNGFRNRYVKKKTTIGKSTVIIHSNFRLSGAAKGNRKQLIKASNEITMKNNNGIKVVCYSPSNRRNFSLKDVLTDDINKDLNRRSYYNSLFLSITKDSNYLKVQKLHNNVDKCISLSVNKSSRYNILPNI